MKIPSLRNRGEKAHFYHPKSCSHIAVSCHSGAVMMQMTVRAGKRKVSGAQVKCCHKTPCFSLHYSPSTLLVLSLPNATGDVCMRQYNSYICSVLRTSQVHLNGPAPILWARKLRHKEIKQLATVTELVSDRPGACIPDWKLVFADPRVHDLTVRYTAFSGKPCLAQRSAASSSDPGG